MTLATVSIRSLFHRDVAKLVIGEILGKSAKLSEVVPSTVVSSRHVRDILDSNPEALVLPLTWPNYMSLYAAQVVQLARLPIRLILFSETNAPEEVLLGLFDAVLSSASEPVRWKQVMSSTLARRLTPDEVRQSISGVLRSAHCFWRPGRKWLFKSPKLRRVSGCRRRRASY